MNHEPSVSKSRQSAIGWDNTLILANNMVELVLSADIGPRILSYRLLDRDNILKVVDDQVGKSGESDWQIRGGHRLWMAPEGPDTYYPDNTVVDWQDVDASTVEVETVEATTGIKKRIRIGLAADSSEVTIDHRITALRDFEHPVSVWALTVLKPGGTAIIPQPPFKPHPNDSGIPDNESLLPNRSIALWPYSNLADPRLRWTDQALEVDQQSHSAAFKIGFRYELGKVHYRVDQSLFSKTVNYLENAFYPDEGCNLELYTDTDILELETLSPLGKLRTGDSITHQEIWTLTPIN